MARAIFGIYIEYNYIGTFVNIYVKFLVKSGLLDNGYNEIAITSEHAVAVDGLPEIHKDPFARILVAQAMIEGIELVRIDSMVAQYPEPVRRV